MNNPKVSIIVPAYNGADYIGEAIQSVLNQTYPYFELLIVDDVSPDDTASVVKQFSDPRLLYIAHEENKGPDVARLTGLRASTGEIIAFLDQDDLYHPEKLERHVTFLEAHPDIGVSYNPRFELDYSAKTIRELWRPPDSISLADLVLWFPIAPSDVVIRREWALRIDLLNGSRGAEILHFSRLFLDGCRFASVDRALNYRRYHAGRSVKDLSGACASEIDNQLRVFSDARCPAEILALQNIAHSNIYMYWAYLAFAQDETVTGQNFIREMVRLKPSVLAGKRCELIHSLLINSIDDENRDHESLLRRILAQLPAEISWLSDQFGWAAAQGYLMKGARAIIWNRPEDGYKHFEHAKRLGAKIDESFLNSLTRQLLNYEIEFGAEAMQNVLHALAPLLKNLGEPSVMRNLSGMLSVNRAFRRYNAGDLSSVPKIVWRAISRNPKYLANRGVLSILYRSTIGRWRKPG